MYSGIPTDTLTRTAVTEGLAFAGVDRGSAQRLGGVVDVGADVASGFLTLGLRAPSRGLSRNVTGLTAQQAAQLEQKLLSIPGASKVRAFGSRTKGTSTAASDLDISLIGNIDRTNPATISIVKEAQAFARQAGIGTGKGLRPLDITTAPSTRAFNQSFRANPNFDPKLGVPRLKPLR